MNTGRNVAASNNPNIDGILTGVAWQNLTLTHSFPTASSQYGMNAQDYAGGIAGSNAPFNGFGVMTVAAQNATREILTEFAQVIPIAISEIVETDTVHADIRSAFSTEPGVNGGSPDGAFAFGPSTGAGGDIFYDNRQGFYNTPVRGDEAYLTLIHEIGHAFGLAHGHTTDGGFPALPAAADTNEFSVMTYRTHVGADPNNPASQAGSWAQSLMMLDIAALQYMYGANFNHNAGNTIYSFNPTTGAMSINGVAQAAPTANIVFRTIWDGNGIDTYDFSNYNAGSSIDLNPGGASTFSQGQLARLSMDGTQLARGNIYNALQFNNDARSLIENANGGGGNDTINGNAANNTLNGNGGNDTINGRDGNDILNGNAGADTIGGDAGNDTIRGGSEDDWLYGLAGGDTINGDEGTDRIWGGTEADTIGGDGGGDFLYGEAGNDYLYGLAGSDFIDGGAGNDVIFGGTEADTIGGGAGSDTLRGEGGNDYIYGNDGGDTVNGNDGDDFLYGLGSLTNLVGGDAGNDFIQGGFNTDYLWGGSGADRFHFVGYSWHDYIQDFEDGVDRINLAGVGWGYTSTTGAGATGAGGVQLQIVDDANGNAFVSLGYNTWISVIGVSAAQLDDTDFIFV